jgi:hypothetical protein
MTNPVSLGVFMTLVVSDIWVWTNNLVTAAQFVS